MTIATESFGSALRDLRQARKLSQLELAFDAELSQRHLSFLESGRARPSRSMVLQLADSLSLPLREQNHLLVAAGFAPVFPQRDLATADMAPVRLALERLLEHHKPYPAFVIDRRWNLVMDNGVLDKLLAPIGDAREKWLAVCGDGPRNALKMTLHPQGLQPIISNLEVVGPYLVSRVRRESLAEPALAGLLDEVLAYPGIPAKWRREEFSSSTSPVLATHFRVAGIELRLFAMLTSFGSPQDLTADELTVEQLFPADAQSESILRAIAGPQSGRTPQ